MITFCGQNFCTPVINTPMPLAWTADQMQDLADQPIALVTSKSITLYPRNGNRNAAGNFDDAHYYTDTFSINSIGLANDGIDAHLKYVQEAYAAKPCLYMISLSGFAVEEYRAMVEQAQDSDAVAFIELNLSCPNTEKDLFCSKASLVKELLEAIKPYDAKPIGIKISPENNAALIDEIVEAIKSTDIVQFITCTNTLGNCFAYREDGTPAIRVGTGFGGMAGGALKPHSLATMIRYKNALKKHELDNIHLIASGGVQSGIDVADYIRAGATLVGVASQIMTEGVECLTRITNEYTEQLTV